MVYENFSVSNKRILITGASSGIGQHIAQTLSNYEANLTITGRDAHRLSETYHSLKGANHESFVSDLSAKEFSQIQLSKPFDGVIFNAGVIDYHPVKFITDQKIRKIFDTNFDGTVLLCSHLLKNKLIAPNGSLVFISSISSQLGVQGTALYAASKAAINTFAKVLATEVANRKIRVNTICPGLVITPMTAYANSVAGAEALSEGEKSYPLGYGTPNDLTGLITFLLSDASRWITGTNIIIDGGLILS